MRLSALTTTANSLGRSDLLQLASGPGDLEIAGLSADSRAVRPGFLFAALPGHARDGRDFLPAALAAGASAVLAGADAEIAVPEGVAVLRAAEPRQAFALLAAAAFPGQPETVVAVTGTNGKTSTAQFARQLWQATGRPSAALGTLGTVAPADALASLGDMPSLTTLDQVSLHRTLAALAAAGIGHAAMEASSHGLDQHRLDGVRLAAGGFTNLTRDHLDYHGTEQDYFAAKARLFTALLPAGAAAVIDVDAAPGARMAELARARGLRLIRYGQHGEELKLLERNAAHDGQELVLRVLGERFTVKLPLVGTFQALNAMCALGLVVGSGTPAADAVPAIAGLQPVRGRLELVGTSDRGAAVYVDYAHTPDALDIILTALRPHTEGRLICAFGCGGDRDRGKRPIMGGIVARRADIAIVTDDNPRSEDPAAIRAEIMPGCPDALEIGDRASAIAEAIARGGPGDIVVIAGKGHEQGQIVQGVTYPFDDAEVARGLLRSAAQ